MTLRQPIFLAFLMLSGCEVGHEAKDHCLHEKLFAQCFALTAEVAKSGANASALSDIIDSCNSFAKWQSYRSSSLIKVECR